MNCQDMLQVLVLEGLDRTLPLVCDWNAFFFLRSIIKFCLISRALVIEACYKHLDYIFSYRACFRKLPKVLCVNTMRYAFNINTMQKEKVNTHFSFPRTLDMSPYMEHNLLGADKLKGMTEVSKCLSSYWLSSILTK